MKKTYYIVLLLLLPIISRAQEGEIDPNSTDERFTISSPVTFDVNSEEKEEDFVEPKKKKRKKKVFYGIKSKRRFTQQGYGNRINVELFHVLKEPIEVDPYVRDIYWFDYRRKEIRIGGKVDQKYGAILHGSYKKMLNGKVITEGIFYKGMKHGRWIHLDKNDLLVDKEKYFFGWPKESLVTYYSREQKKLKEIIPVEYGEKEGNYFYFFDNGKVGVAGEYKWDNRVGDWIEYYPTGRRKKVIRYSKEAFDDDFRPYIWKEWDKQGRLVYERKNR